jgi:diacylglycerol kinase (ATP)
MRAAAILGLGCSPRHLKAFQSNKGVEWRIGMPGASDEADVVVLFGGDGTVHRHLGQLVVLGLPLLVVPAGSGNDFATSLGLRRVRDSRAAWEKFCSRGSNVRFVDLGMIAGFEAAGRPGPHQPGHQPGHQPRYFCCVAGVGLDGEVSRRANQFPRWLRRHGGYVLSLIPTIFTFAPLPMKILSSEADNQNAGWTSRSHQPTLLAAFANTPLYGGGMKVAPQAKMDDGLIDVCIVGGLDPFKLFCMFPTVYSGRHLGVREIQYFQASRARIETEHPLDVYADGEFVCRTPVEVSVHRKALKVITL